jgi:hypothetical protein
MKMKTSKVYNTKFAKLSYRGQDYSLPMKTYYMYLNGTLVGYVRATSEHWAVIEAQTRFGMWECVDGFDNYRKARYTAVLQD